MKVNKILSVISVSLISISMLGIKSNANIKPIDDLLNNPGIEKINPLNEIYFIKSLEELKSLGVLSQKDINNINDYIIKFKEKKRTEKIMQNQYRGNKENKIKGNKYNNNNDKKRSLIDCMVNDKVITKAQGDRLKETIRKNRVKIKSNIENQ
jgi:hypothetical protein